PPLRTLATTDRTERRCAEMLDCPLITADRHLADVLNSVYCASDCPDGTVEVASSRAGTLDSRQLSVEPPRLVVEVRHTSDVAQPAISLDHVEAGAPLQLAQIDRAEVHGARVGFGQM